MNYRRGHTVHWIQARLAIEDGDSWEQVEVAEAGDGAFTVVTSSNERILRYSVRANELSPRVPIRAALSDRWGVLAVAPGQGATGGIAHATGIGDPVPFKILSLAGASFFSVSREPLEEEARR